MQWKAAAPRLQAIRDAELQMRDRKSVPVVEGRVIYEPNPEKNGLVIMQRWRMRLALLRDRPESKASP